MAENEIDSNQIIAGEIIKILSNQLSKPESKINLKDKIVDELGADSLDVIEMLMTLEQKYGLTISEQNVSKILTVQDLIDYITSSINAR